MPYSTVGIFNKEYSALNGLHFCACGEPCTVRVRGTRWGEDRWSHSKRVPCHRWLCEQCYQNLLDDDAHLRVIEHQHMTPEQDATWDAWFDEYGHTL